MSINNVLAMSDVQLIDGVLGEFEPLTHIPRQSLHEKAVSDYLYKVFTELGCTVIQDKVNNIIADLPAASGYEEKPLVVLQGHMDMVCVADSGYAYDPLVDPIKMVREGDRLHAEHTSLGADDGIGVATIIFLMKTLKAHGPMRAIITVDEELGMSGAENLAAEALAGAKYLINCDSEDWDLLTVGSAGCADIGFARNLQREAVKYPNCYKLELSKLLGGHSGIEINSGHANAIKVLALLLYTCKEQGIDYQLLDLQGGSARNVIPGQASAVIAAEADLKQLEAVAEKAIKDFKKVYGNVEEQAEFTITTCAGKQAALTSADSAALLKLLLVLQNGVAGMSNVDKALVQSSANLGMVKMTEARVEVVYMPRSSVDRRLEEYCIEAKTLAELTGFELRLGSMAPGWAENPKSKLTKLMAEIFAEQNKQPMRVASIHAGLECGYFFNKNQELDIVSIGTNNKNIHSPKETLELHTVPPHVRLIAATLEALAQ